MLRFKGGNLVNSISKKLKIPIVFIISTFIFLSLFYVSRINYVLFHSLLEITILVIGICLMIIAIITKDISDNYYYTFMGVSYGFVAIINLFHFFSYKGSGIIHVSTDIPTQLWIIQRYFEVVSILISFNYLNKKVKIKKVMAVEGILVTSLLLMVFIFKIFPVCYIEGQGLTPFKVISEYITALMLAYSIFLYSKNMNHKRIKDNSYLLIISMIFKIFSGLAFVIYISVYDMSNFIGHIFNFISYIFIYKALIDTLIKDPYKVLFQELKEKLENVGNSNREITKQKFKLEHDYKRYEEVIDAMPQGLIIIQGEKIIYFNNHIKNMLGLKHAKMLLGRNIYDLIDVTCHDKLKKRLYEMHKNSEINAEGCLLMWDRKKYPVEISAYAIIQEGVKYFVFLIK